LALPWTVESAPVRWAAEKVLGILQKAGWNGVWVDNCQRLNKFGQAMPPSPGCELPSHNYLFDKIITANGGGRSGCWDLFAWRGEEFLFVDAKMLHTNDEIRPNQIRWLEASLRCGIRPKAFVILEWELVMTASSMPPTIG
jgi:hypothetical protein